MRKLIRFIETYSFFFLFLLFEGLAFYLLFRENHFQRASILNYTTELSGKLYNQYSKFTDYFYLEEVNQQLAKENNRLREKQLSSFEKLLSPNYLINDTIYQQQYFYTKAKVVNNSINKQNNYLTLNVGSINGIKIGMGVISPNGVVGIVENVSKHYSTVISQLHASTKISVKLKNSDYFGSMQWDGKSYEKGILMDIPNHVRISIGDTIVTTSYSTIFPPNLVVATVESIDKPEGENFYNLHILFTTDFKSLGYVYVVKNKWGAEQKELEEKTKDENG